MRTEEYLLETSGGGKVWLQPYNIASDRHINYPRSQYECVFPKHPLMNTYRTLRNHKILYWPSAHCWGGWDAISLEPRNIGAWFSNKLGWQNIKSERQIWWESWVRVYINHIKNSFIWHKCSQYNYIYGIGIVLRILHVFNFILNIDIFDYL